MGAKISKHGSYTLEKRPKKKKKGAKLEERAPSFISLSQSQIYEDEIKTPLPQPSARSKSVGDINKNGEILEIPKISTVFNTTSSERDDYSSPDDEKIYENILEQDASTEVFGSLNTSEFEEQMERRNSAPDIKNQVLKEKKRRTWSQSESHPEDYFDVREKLSSISSSEKNEVIVQHHHDENWKDILNGGFWTGGIRATQVEQTKIIDEQIEVDLNWHEKEDEKYIKNEDKLMVIDGNATNFKVQAVYEEEQVEMNSENIQLSHQMKETQFVEDDQWDIKEDHGNQGLFSGAHHLEVNNLHITLIGSVFEEKGNNYQQNAATNTIEHLESQQELAEGSTDTEQLEVVQKNSDTLGQEEELPPKQLYKNVIAENEEQHELLATNLNKTIQDIQTLENRTIDIDLKAQFTSQSEDLLETNVTETLKQTQQQEGSTSSQSDINLKQSNDSEEQMEVFTDTTRHKTLSKSVSVNSDIYYEPAEDGLMVETDNEEQESFYDAMDFEDAQNEAQVEVLEEDDTVKNVKSEKELEKVIISDHETSRTENLRTGDKEANIKNAEQEETESHLQYDLVEIKEDRFDVLPDIFQENTNISSATTEGLLIVLEESQLDMREIDNKLQSNQNLAKDNSLGKPSEEIKTVSSLYDEEENVGVLIELDGDETNIQNSLEGGTISSKSNQQNTQTTKAKDLNAWENQEAVYVNTSNSANQNVNSGTGQNFQQEIQETRNDNQLEVLEADVSTNSGDNSNQAVTLIKIDKVTGNTDKLAKESQHILSKKNISENAEDTSNQPLLIDLANDRTNAQFLDSSSSPQNTSSTKSISESPLEDISTKNNLLVQDDLRQSLTLVDSTSDNSNFSASENIHELNSKSALEPHVFPLENKPTQDIISKPNSLPLPQTKQNHLTENEKMKGSLPSTTPEETARDQMKKWDEQEAAEVEEAISQINACIDSIEEVKSKIDGLESSEKAKEMQGEMYQILIKIMREVNSINNHNFNERVIEVQHKALNDVHECLRQLQVKTLT